MGIKLVWQLFETTSTEQDWITFFKEAKKQNVKVLAAVTNSDYVPLGCTQENGQRCVLGPERRFLESVKNNPDVYRDTLYGFLLIDEPFKDMDAQQLKWMYEDAKAIVDAPLVVGWSRQLWKFKNNPRTQFSDGMCDICLVSSLEFRDYGDGPFFDKETLIANHLFSRQAIRAADPDAKLITSIQVFGSKQPSGSSYYMPSVNELDEMVNILFSDQLQSAGKLDGVVWQTWKALYERTENNQNNLSDPKYSGQRNIAKKVCGPDLTAQDPGPLKSQASVGYIGCSNSKQAVYAYHDASIQPHLWQEYDTGGLEITKWADESHRAWQLFDQKVSENGNPDAVWVNVCERAANQATTQDIENAITILQSKVGSNIPIYLSPLNKYADDAYCGVLVNGSSDHIEALVAETLANNPTIKTGPSLGPLSRSQLLDDGCHLNALGLEMVGGQMVQFFD